MNLSELTAFVVCAIIVPVIVGYVIGTLWGRK